MGSVFTFIAADGSERVLQPQAETSRINAIAAFLGQRIAAGSIVGLLFRSEPDLIVTWFAALRAGLRPLILQYPTRKQSRAYWLDSVRNTIAVTELAALIADAHCAGLGLSDLTQTVCVTEFDDLPAGKPGGLLPDDYAIIQLSSGTTGYRKAMQFDAAALARHAADYNQVLQLEPGRDRIVSWLPLYHDMGYVACFVMPLLLGIDVVMIDPIDWVSRPELLLTAIERHRGTVCYMPNFGFEVMSRELGDRATPADLSSMRRWISCSEPVSLQTSEKFLQRSGSPPESFSPCYAMAENIFAVSIGSGLRTTLIDDVEVLSCGQPIPGVEIKVVEHEIWARSPTSLAHYQDGKDIRDEAGFYPTGDLGLYQDGELYVSGRKQDLLIQAGRKFILSDIDLRLNELRPDVRGRAATLALRDQRLGTETPTILIEARDFFDRTDADEIAAAMKDATSLDQVEVAFVPPRFLTKTSSGKINRRKSGADWLAVLRARAGGAQTVQDPVADLRASFATANWDKPVTEALDSLSVAVLRIILEATPVRYNRQWSLAAYAEALTKGATGSATAVDEGIRIVSLADLATIRKLLPAHMERLREAFGCRVTWDYICLPPSPILLSDLIFHDYFQPRLEDQAAFAAVNRAMEKLREASVIIMDDKAEMFLLPQSTYPALSHGFERDPRADLISFRWPAYVQHHDQLPLTVVGGRDISLETASATMDQLRRYLGVPMLRIGRLDAFSPYTKDWEYHPVDVGNKNTPIDLDGFVDRMIEWVHALPAPLARRTLRAKGPVVNADPGHFCAHKVRQETIDRVLQQYESFIIAGQSASVPYVQRELDRLSKTYIRVSSHVDTALAELRDQYECLIICGTWGDVPVGMPALALQHLGPNPRVSNMPGLNVDADDINELVDSNEDWFFSFAFDRDQSEPIARQARLELNKSGASSRRSRRGLAP